MQIILTHEQADFDALASLLGAHMLNEVAIPVLPRRLNRNVRAFITLYGMELPFVDPRDLPNVPIEKVTLVDTQSMISVKGMKPDTEVQVIDHHPLRDKHPENWSVTTVETGATTTLLVEALREQSGQFSTIQSTLLLLGIYEDTGSLTYTRTMARDLRAAAFLIERGASLQIANDFINHPLSHVQQILYDSLRASAEYFNIYGHSVVLVCGDAQDINEELSSVAHKLRDLLDPDALIMLVKTRGGIQLIARSTSDHIDVGILAANYGGGGHERAAAGLIKGKTLEEVCSGLVRSLPEYVRPSITVSQIMSRDPQLLSPDTPVDEAADRMQRYGYEGYPVVEDNKIVGLLTRRAVDRAMSHKLNLKAGSLMEAGEYSVNPDDSIEYLQRIMTDTGWGQIPVVAPTTNEIIGIVTRTDLLKTLTRQIKSPIIQNLASRLEAALPRARINLLKTIADGAHKQGASLYIVGGFVRDLILNHPSVDFDLVVEGDAIALTRALVKKYGGRVTSHSRFGTAKWHLSENWVEVIAEENSSHDQKLSTGSIDLVSARREFYTYPTALPTVERGSIKLDLHRRDFTINTIALRLDGPHYGELFDYWGGLNDLHLGLVRVLHSLSFVDDPTRMLRAVRFEQRFNFKIGKRTIELLAEAISLLESLSGDRIRNELNHILLESNVTLIMRRLNELGLLKAIHTDLIWDEWIDKRFGSLDEFKLDRYWGLNLEGDLQSIRCDLAYTLWLMRLEPMKAKSIIKRLRLSTELEKIILAASGLWRERINLSKALPSTIVTRLENVPALTRYAFYIATSNNVELKKQIQMYVSNWQKISPTIDGNYLKQRGLPPGPIYRQILSSLRNAWLDGKITTVEEEADMLESILRETPH
jgi:tRNA nucleotidyltransferase (CCA-adding enzyme)